MPKNYLSFLIVSGTGKISMASTLEEEGEIPAEYMLCPKKFISDFPNSHLTGLITTQIFRRAQKRTAFA